MIRATEGAFPNEIYDRDVLPAYHTTRCVLIGDAAHSSTPHYVRGTHMAIQDGYALGKAIGTVVWNSVQVSCKDFQDAFGMYEAERLDYSNNVVLTARRLGRVKQGVFSAKQDLNWDLTCTSSELSDMLNDKVIDVSMCQ